jgi:hypothetical protein
VAAANIARKLAWLRHRGDQKRADVPDEERTSWEQYAAATPLPLGAPWPSDRLTTDQTGTVPSLPDEATV